MHTEVFEKEYDADLEESELSTAIEETSIDEVQADVEESADVEEAPLVIKTLPDLIIDERIVNRIPPLTAEKNMLLDKSVVKDGCRDSLIAWEGYNILIDGNHRYDICKKRNIPFNVIYKVFKDIEEVLEWVDDNQAGRRNLTTDQKAIIIGRRYNREKKNTNDNLKQNSPKGQNVPSVNTAEKFAKENHINEKTVKRYGKIATEFDTMEVKNPSVAKEVFSGKTKFKDVKEKQPKKNPAEKKAIKQPTPTDDTNVSTEDNTSIGALETGVESKDIVLKPDNKPWISPAENTLMNLIVKTQRKIIDYQEKRSEVAKKIVAHQKLSKEHTDKVVSNIDKKAKEEKEKLIAADVKKLRTLTLKSDAITFDITEALKELGSQIVFHCDFKTVKADDFKAKISIDNSMKEIESPAKFEFTEEHIENLIKQNELIEKTNAEILDLEMNAKNLLNDADLMDKISDIKYQLGHKLTKEK